LQNITINKCYYLTKFHYRIGIVSIQNIWTKVGTNSNLVSQLFKECLTVKLSFQIQNKIANSNHILHLPLKFTNVTQNLVKSSKCSQNSTIEPGLTESTKHAYHLELPSKNTSIILKIDFRLKLQF
jgi:hypothetical protein